MARPRILTMALSESSSTSPPRSSYGGASDHWPHRKPAGYDTSAPSLLKPASSVAASAGRIESWRRWRHDATTILRERMRIDGQNMRTVCIISLSLAVPSTSSAHERSGRPWRRNIIAAVTSAGSGSPSGRGVDGGGLDPATGWGCRALVPFRPEVVAEVVMNQDEHIHADAGADTGGHSGHG